MDYRLLHNLVNAQENWVTFLGLEQLARGSAKERVAVRQYNRLKRTLTRPMTKSNALQFKIAEKRRNNIIAESARKKQNALNRLTRAKAAVRNAFGRNVSVNNAAQMLQDAYARAVTTVAKALNSSPVVKRAMNKRRARNMIRAELAFYANSASPLRPSKIARTKK